MYKQRVYLKSGYSRIYESGEPLHLLPLPRTPSPYHPRPVDKRRDAASTLFHDVYESFVELDHTQANACPFFNGG